MTINDKHVPPEDRCNRKFYKRANKMTRQKLEDWFARHMYDTYYDNRLNDYIDNYVDRFGGDEFYDYINELIYSKR